MTDGRTARPPRAVALWRMTAALWLLAGPAVAAEGVRVAAPAGYCIDTEASARSGLVLLGRCEGVGNRPPAILSAAVGKPGSGRAVEGRGVEMARFFRSPQGRAALSRSGDPGTVRVLDALGIDDAFLLRLQDTSPGNSGQVESWRAVVAVNGRLVTLTATGTGAAPLGRDDGKRLIRAFVAAMRAANAGSAGN